MLKKCSSSYDHSVDITTTRRKLYSFVEMSLLKLCLRKQAIDFCVMTSNCPLVWQWIYDLYYRLRLQPSSETLIIFYYCTDWSYLNGQLTPVLFSGIIDRFFGGNATDLSPHGRKPQDRGSRSGWKTEGPHYIIAISLLGSWIPGNKTLVGMYEHTNVPIGGQTQHNNRKIYCDPTENTVIKENKGQL